MKVRIKNFPPFRKELWGGGMKDIKLNYHGDMKAGTSSVWWCSS